MGLLDEAIREHLELMRRRGATPEEIQRREHDALAPVVSRGNGESGAAGPAAAAAEAADPAPSQATPPPDVVDAGGSSPSDHAAEPGEPGSQPSEPQGFAPEHPVMPEPAGHEPSAEPYGEAELEAVSGDEPARASKPFVSEELWLDDDADDRDPAPAAAQSPDQPTRGFSAGEIAAAEGTNDDAAADDDVLQETPEFLQETPEHDRLWFEQRPPRRFDFDSR